MALLRGMLALLALIIIVIIAWYFTTGLRLPQLGISTSTVPANIINSTTSSTTIIYNQECGTFTLFTQMNSTSQINTCTWKGGPLGLWVAGGNSGSEHFTLTGADSKTYINETASYQCVTFYNNYTLPAQTYTATLTSGHGTLNTTQGCPYTMVVMNTTLNPPPKIVYQQLYNGNFSTATYTGWNMTGKGFGADPLNITRANNNTSNTPSCYLGSPWANYPGLYIATTYNCGITVSPGNLTSSPFYASKAFLNFRIVSPQDNFLYVEILYNNTPYIIAHYNTYNISFGPNTLSTFRNASIPLVTVVDKPIQIKVVADTQLYDHFIAVSGFYLSNKPNQDKGILQGLNFTH
jgi:hypothetical protein